MIQSSWIQCTYSAINNQSARYTQTSTHNELSGETSEDKNYIAVFIWGTTLVCSEDHFKQNRTHYLSYQKNQYPRNTDLQENTSF